MSFNAIKTPACVRREGGSSVNTRFEVEPEDLIPSLAAQPADSPSVDLETYVIDWQSRGDGLTPEEASAFFPSEEFLHAPLLLPKHRPTTSTRLGGVPFWIQSWMKRRKWAGAFWGSLIVRTVSSEHLQRRT